MKIIDTFRSKPHAYKIRLIWISVALAALLMVIIWVLTSRFSKHSPADTTIFQTIGRGLKDIKDNYKK